MTRQKESLEKNSPARHEPRANDSIVGMIPHQQSCAFLTSESPKLVAIPTRWHLGALFLTLVARQVASKDVRLPFSGTIASSSGDIPDRSVGDSLTTEYAKAAHFRSGASTSSTPPAPEALDRIYPLDLTAILCSKAARLTSSPSTGSQTSRKSPSNLPIFQDF